MMATPRFRVLLLSAFAAFALLPVAIGLNGIVAEFSRALTGCGGNRATNTMTAS
jgi:hypothetical protein